jgi:GNAT superfamily N-acetyltransferase
MMRSLGGILKGLHPPTGGQRAVNDQSFCVSHATPLDAEAVFALHIASILAHCAGHYTPEQIEAWVRPKRAEDYVRAMEAGEAMFVARVADGTVVGFSSIRDDEVHAVYVAPGWAGKGIGLALLTELEAHARRSGVRTIRLRSSVNAHGAARDALRTNHRSQTDGSACFWERIQARKTNESRQQRHNTVRRWPGRYAAVVKTRGAGGEL